MSKKQLVSAENISVVFGDQEVINIEKFYVYEGEKVGLVGVNGAGKTTFLRVLSGELEPDAGKIHLMCEPFFFHQFSEEVDYWELDGKEIKSLGIKDKIWQASVSGGEDTRIRLAQAFSSDRPLVFLDEPTANLDMGGIALLRKKLSKIESMIIVSHDRALLNDVCTRIVEIEFGKMKSYDGNYDAYLCQKQLEQETKWSEYERYAAEKKRLQGVVAAKKEKARSIVKKPKNMSAKDMKDVSFGGSRKIEDKARGMENAAKNVQNRLAHMDVKEKPKTVAKIRPDFRLTNPPENRIVISGENINFAYDGQDYVLKNASFRIQNGTRVAIIGANGAGKTTLLHLIRDENQTYHVPKAKFGIFEQNLAHLDFDKTVLENVMDVSIQKEEMARIILARLLLSEKDMKKKVSVLSGGERIKLAFARLFVSDVNVLLLDEPTNYLDIPSVEALEELFSEYEGTLVFVSHDEAFIKAVATDILEVKDGEIVPYYGAVMDYFE